MSGAEIALLASTALTAGSQILGGYTQGQAADANAQALETQAQSARDVAGAEAERTRAQVERGMGAARAAAGGSGLTPSGSILDSLVTSAMEGELEAQIAAYQGRRQSWEARTQAQQLRYDAKAARRGGWLAAGTALAGGLSQAYQNGSFGGGGVKTAGQGGGWFAKAGGPKGAGGGWRGGHGGMT